MFLQDHTVPTSLSPTWGNRTGLAKAFNSLAADGGLMMTELLARELARPLKDEKELRTIVEQARNTGPQPTHRKMEETARVQRAAAHGLAAVLALGEDLNDEEKLAELDKIAGELVTILASRMTDPLPIFPQPPVADLMGACAEHLPTLGRCAVMRMWRNLGFQPQFCMR